MAKENIWQWDETPANNSEIDGIDISGATGKVKDGDNAIREMMAQVITAEGKGTAIASAATLTLSGPERYFHITGSTGPITDIDFTDAVDGRWAWLIFDSTPTITHNATTLKLPGGANIVAEAGDRGLFIQDSSDNVICLVYERANGSPVTAGTWTPTLVSTGATFSYAANTGQYVKVGSLVFLAGVISLNTSGNTLTANGCSLAGLPFTSATPGRAIFPVEWANSTSSFTIVTLDLNASSNSADFNGATAAATSNLSPLPSNQLCHATNGTVLRFSGCYRAA
jgi:hypothetical protein